MPPFPVGSGLPGASSPILGDGVSIEPRNAVARVGLAATSNTSKTVTSGNKIPNMAMDTFLEDSCCIIPRYVNPADIMRRPQINSPAPAPKVVPPPIVPSNRASSRRSRPSFDLSDDDIEKRFRVPKEAYIEAPGMQNVCSAWSNYLDLNNYRQAFQPLCGIERDRYRPIIEDAKAEENVKRRVAFETINIIQAVRPLISQVLNNSRYQYLSEDSEPGDGLGEESGDRNGSLPPAQEQCVRDMEALEQGFDKLWRYLERGLRYTRYRPTVLKGHYTTKYGILTACNMLPEEDWFVGHRPGDPVVRIKENPIDREEDPFYVYDLAGLEDGDEPETHRVGFEGVVPFNAEELYQRFTQYVLPTFVQMGIAAVGFDPRDIEHGARFWAQQLENVRATEFEEFAERDRAKLLKLLRRLWHVKHGTETKNYPNFLRAQIANSISCLREMGWLMSKLERDAPSHARHHYWNHCKGLLHDFTGLDAGLLAQEYFDITLAQEAKCLLTKGDLADVLFYRQSRTSRAWEKLQDIYNPEGPDADISLQEIIDLRDLANKYHHANWFPAWSFPQPAEASSAEPPAEPPVAPAATIENQVPSKKRKASKTDQGHDGDNDDLPAPPPKKRAKRDGEPHPQPKATPKRATRPSRKKH
ncbi:hypothetical protein F5Y10DRAFT_260496 [Nemania abortiva]|nr:hypothetical protein F5Y10DRAFT_260496 [Nemania abortiva]